MDDVAFEPLTGPAHQVWDDPATVWTAPIVEGAGRATWRETRSGRRARCASAPASCATASTSTRTTSRSRPRSSRFLDYKKGCYVGQEPVFRVHAQGNAARALRGLAIEGSAPIARGRGDQAPGEGQRGRGDVVGRRRRRHDARARLPAPHVLGRRRHGRGRGPPGDGARAAMVKRALASSRRALLGPAATT